jgi:hypothetical protein
MLKHYEKLEGNKELKFSIYMEKSGYSYLTNTRKKSGIRVSISPVEVSKTDNFVMETVSAFSGIGFYVMEAERKSVKKENMIFDAVKKAAPEIKDLFLSLVLPITKNTNEYDSALNVFAAESIKKIKTNLEAQND